MIDRKNLLGDLQKVLKTLETDRLERSDSTEVPHVREKLRRGYTDAQAAERTAQSYEEWRSDAITQAAAAWVLSCVFVRFLEDNELVAAPKISGPEERLKRARDEHEVYFRRHPTLTDRHYLLNIFDALTNLGAMKDVFGEHNPIHDRPDWLSGDAAGALIAFFQKIDPNTGVLVHDFTDPEWDTRFLGDLYQELSDEARKKYALLQTPVFVEEFILDRTLDPAIEEFGLAKMGYELRLLPDGRLHSDDRFKMIDPACGSGHFLIGSFARLAGRWRTMDPVVKIVVLVQRALDGVHGVDLNPFAIAIARFRLLLAALKECSITRLSDAPGFEIHLACGDSLLHGSRGGDQLSLGWSSVDHVYQPEDRAALETLLRPGTYFAVVANPPYISPKDKALNQAYRERYATCHRQYSLAVPFLERIVSLAVNAGYTGQITAKSFMKREFGKKLIEEFFPHVDLTHVIDTSGAYIPGHGTPTVILFVRNRKPIASVLRTVMGIRGEPFTPDDPSKGQVWSSIVAQVDEPGSQSEFVSVSDSSRALFSKHPWSIGGGGVAELKEQLEKSAQSRLRDLATEIGFVCITKADDFFMQPAGALRRAGLESRHLRRFGIGEQIRDWCFNSDLAVIFPYDKLIRTAELDAIPRIARFAWPFRTELGNRIVFGGENYFAAGKPWYEYGQIPIDRARIPLSIVFAFVATHNHFVLDRGGNIFKQSAPVIKLPSSAKEDDHVGLTGVLNSSVVGFLMRQFGHNMGDSTDDAGARTTGDSAFNTFQFNSTQIGSIPLPNQYPFKAAKYLESVAWDRQRYLPATILYNRVITREEAAGAQASADEALGRMIATQEELDWQCYRLYELIRDDLTFPEPPLLKLGERAFEIVLARRLAAGESQTTWFERHKSSPITEIPAHWPTEYRKLVDRRITIIETDPRLGLIEQPEYKRRWNTESWDSQLERALREWLLARLESFFDFDGRMNDEGRPTARLAIALTTVGKLADIARKDPDFLQVGELYRNDPAFDLTWLVAELVEGESMPLLPILRYKPSGLRKREEWENTWTLQRREDAIDARTTLRKDDPRHLSEVDAKELKKKEVGTIPVPPKYTSADFLKSDYWRLRGKLDVPKEHWVSFPHCEGEDGTLTVAWAGYDHLQLTRAISAFYVDVKDRLGGRDDPRLVPLLAYLIELLPWLKQWHNEVDPEFGLMMGDYFDGFVQEESRNLGLTLDETKAWQPPQRIARRPRASGARAGSRRRKRTEDNDSPEE